MKRHTMVIVITLILAGMLSCSSGDTVTVTIDTGIRKQAQLTVWDKVLAWITLSQAVKADPVPIELVEQINSIEVTISASDMGTITETIPTTTGRITLDVPAGSQRTFEVVAKDSDLLRFYGGIATVDLSAGQQVTLNIEMGKLVLVSDLYVGYNCNDGFVLGYYNDDINLLDFVMLYISNDLGETWNFLQRVDKNQFVYNEECSDWEYDFDESETVSYRAVGYNQYGQGSPVEYIYTP